MTKNFVIAICSISGGGKSTLVRNTASLLNAVSLFFDDYVIGNEFILDKDWIERQGDFNELKTPRLSTDLEKLKNGEEIIYPGSDSIVKPADYIVVEEPTGRERKEMADHIDFCVFIDTPLDIGLARRLWRDFLISTKMRVEEKRNANEEFFEVKDIENGVNNIREYLDYYQNEFRWYYIEQLKRVKPNCDLVLDGLLPPEELSQQLVASVKDFRKICERSHQKYDTRSG